jgi:hypothetical protein
LDGDKFGLVHDADINIAGFVTSSVLHILQERHDLDEGTAKQIAERVKERIEDDERHKGVNEALERAQKLHEKDMINDKSITALNWKAGLSMRTAVKLQRQICAVPRKSMVLARDGIDYPMTEEEMGWYLDFFMD